MAKKSNKKPIIIGAIILAIVAAVVAIVIIVNKNNGLRDAYFKTDSNKIVINPLANDPQAAQMGATKIHQVYEIKGEEVTAVKFYAEFEDNDKAKAANDSDELKVAIENGSVKSRKLKGKYLVLEMPLEITEGRTVAEIRETAEYYSQYENGSYPVEDNTEHIDYTFADDSEDFVDDDDDNIPVEDYVEAAPSEEESSESAE